MKKFIITEEQANIILAALGETPAKISYKATEVLLRGLTEYAEPSEVAAAAAIENYSLGYAECKAGIPHRYQEIEKKDQSESPKPEID